MTKLIGSGSHGEVYDARHSVTGERVAIKLSSTKEGEISIRNELCQYSAVMPGADGGHPPRNIALPITSGCMGKNTFLIQKLLGPSLEEVMDARPHILSIRSVFMVGLQILTTLEYIHSKGILHRDIHPGNLVIGRTSTDCSVIHLIDFGSAGRWRDEETQRQISIKERPDLSGLTMFACAALHLRKHQSRRDDLESLIYTLAYLATGSLPWENVQYEDRNTRLRLASEKNNQSSRKICSGIGELADALEYIRRLQPPDRPDYEYLRTIFRYALTRRVYGDNVAFDWELRRPVI